MRSREEDVFVNMQSGYEPDKTDPYQKAQNFEQVVIELLREIRDALVEIQRNTKPRGYRERRTAQQAWLN